MSTNVSVRLLVLVSAVVQFQSPAMAQNSHEGHGAHGVAKVEVPKIFLDKSPKIVEYQLKRLSNEQLLLVERKADDPKYIPIHVAIAERIGMSIADRKSAVESLATLQKTSITVEIFKILNKLDEKLENRLIARDLVQVILSQPPESLKAAHGILDQSIDANSSLARRGAWAALLSGDNDTDLGERIKKEERILDFLQSFPWVSSPAKRNRLRPQVVALLDNQSIEIQKAAIQAMETIESDGKDSFVKLAAFFSNDALRNNAIHALLKIPMADRDPILSASLAKELVLMAERTPAELRTEDPFLDAMQLVDGLLPWIDPTEAKEYRQRLDAVTVRVIRIETVMEEMRYDLKHFAVQAGRPCQIVLKNSDLMPHNLVITTPGKLKEVALLAAAMAPDEAPTGKQYVPQNENVLWATGMVQANKQERLTFTAPTVPGEYPYVCTFPNHWMRMYGVMVVINDLDRWLKNPQPPTDPIGNNRSFVKKWRLLDLESQIESGLRGRSDEIGARLLKEATCLQCHQHGAEGRIIGPSLTDLAARWKGNSAAILREVLEPSHTIDPKYATQTVVTEDGKTYSGIVLSANDESITFAPGPDQKAPTVIKRSEIEEVAKSSKSMMPDGLMDQYTQDEIFELLAYLVKPRP